MNAINSCLAALPGFAPDLAFVVLSAAFFAGAAAFAWLCEKLR